MSWQHFVLDATLCSRPIGSYCLSGFYCLNQIDDLVQDCSNSIANALELLQSWIKPLKLSLVAPKIIATGTCERLMDGSRGIITVWWMGMWVKVTMYTWQQTMAPYCCGCRKTIHTTAQQLWTRLALCSCWIPANFTHIVQGYFIGIGPILWLSQWQWSNLKEYEQLSHINQRL